MHRHVTGFRRLHLPPVRTPRAARTILASLTALLTVFLSAPGLAGAAPAAAPSVPVDGAAPQRLRLQDVRALPGHPAAGAALPTGSVWQLGATRLQGPPPLGCGHVHARLLAVPADGLFQGTWQGSADEAAALGLRSATAGRPTATLRLDCDTGSFDLHQADDGAFLLALDGRVLRWQPAPAADDPRHATQALLLRHLGGPGGLDAAVLQALRPWLASALHDALADWLVRPQPDDEVPLLDGDPFLDTQEPPQSIGLGRTRRDGATVRQAVWLHLEGRPPRAIDYHWRREAGRWKLQDVAYGHGPGLRQLLAPAAPAGR